MMSIKTERKANNQKHTAKAKPQSILNKVDKLDVPTAPLIQSFVVYMIIDKVDSRTADYLIEADSNSEKLDNFINEFMEVMSNTELGIERFEFSVAIEVLSEAITDYLGDGETYPKTVKKWITKAIGNILESDSTIELTEKVVEMLINDIYTVTQKDEN